MPSENPDALPRALVCACDAFTHVALDASPQTAAGKDKASVRFAVLHGLPSPQPDSADAQELIQALVVGCERE